MSVETTNEWCAYLCHIRHDVYSDRQPKRELFGRDVIEWISMSDLRIPCKYHKTSTNNYDCPHMKLANEYQSTLGWKNSLSDPSLGKCFCPKCYPSKLSDVTQVSNAEYVIAHDWMRLGIHADKALVHTHDIWSKWLVTFHGTYYHGCTVDSQLSALFITRWSNF